MVFVWDGALRWGGGGGGGGGGGLVSVFQGFFAGINKILDLAGGLGARVALGH